MSSKYTVVHLAQREVTAERLEAESPQGYSLVGCYGTWKVPFGIGLFKQPFVTLIFRKGS